MKKLLISLLFVVGCASAQVDDSNNVSVASYKSAIVRGQQNLFDIKDKLTTAKANDKTHGAGWWDANIGLISDTMVMFSSTLTGSNVSTVKSQ